MIKALACFIDWNMPARKLWFPVDMTPELQRRAIVMKRRQTWADKRAKHGA